MNYYIQGDAANADKIKAAFEQLGYDVSGFDMCNDNILFFTYKLQGGGKVISTANANLYTANIIKTHPDYKELLSVEPKFKVGDWLAANEPNNYARFVHVEGIEDSLYLISKIGGAFGSVDRPCISFVEEYYHPFSIQDVKDGDVITNGKLIVIFNKLEEPAYRQHIIAYVGLDLCGRLQITEDTWQLGVDKVMPATKEQRDLLFAKMEEAGYEWDANKMELKKLKQHYDISNFKPFDNVLVRDGDKAPWRADFFEEYDDNFYCFRGAWEQCIPFNEETKHLLGTTDMPSEEFINW